MTGWSCRYEVTGICQRVDGAWCRPGMKGCVLVGKVSFQDGQVPSPVWPPGHPRTARDEEASGGASGAAPEGDEPQS